MKILLEIRKMQKKLNNSITKNGLNSQKTREISLKVDELINEYYESIKTVQFPSSSNSDYYFNKSYERLKIATLNEQKFPSIEEWNKIAEEEGLFSAVSMQYISMLDWNHLRTKIEREINLKII